MPSPAEISVDLIKQIISGPLGRAVEATGNWILPNLVPPVQAAWDVYRRGMFADEADAIRLLNLCGIDAQNNIWQAYASGLIWQPSIEQTLAADVLGTLTPRNLDWAKRRNSMHLHGGHWVSAYKSMPRIWSPLDSAKLYQLDKIAAQYSPSPENVSLGPSINKYMHRLMASGMWRSDDRDDFERLLQSDIPEELLLQMWLRGYLGTNAEKKVDQILVRNGVLSQEMRDAVKKMRWYVPTESELSEFAIKEVWNKDVVHSLGYDDEFDLIPQYRIWMDRSGGGGPANIPKAEVRKYLVDHGATADEAEKQAETVDESLGSWAQAHWRAHWRVISNEQAYTMLHRLRPTGGTSGVSVVRNNDGTITTTNVAGPLAGNRRAYVDVRQSDGSVKQEPVEPVTMEDVVRVLKINDYPPVWRNRLAAISYLPLRLVDIRRVVSLALSSPDWAAKALPVGVDARAWSIEEFMDRGQTREQSTLLADMTVESAQRSIDRPKQMARNRRKVSWTRLVLKYYRDGIRTRARTIAGLQDLGYSYDDIEPMVSSIDEQLHAETTKALVGAVQRQIFRGDLDITSALKIIEPLGLTDEYQARLEARWKLYLVSEEAEEQIRRIRRLLLEGVITPDRAEQRLRNLSIDDPSSLVDQWLGRQAMREAQQDLMEMHGQSLLPAMLDAARRWAINSGAARVTPPTPNP